MNFLRKLFPSITDRVAETTDPYELVLLYRKMDEERKYEERGIVEARLVDVLSEVSDLDVLEQCLVLSDDKSGGLLKELKQTTFSFDGAHVMALGEEGDSLKQLIALAEVPNIAWAVNKENLSRKLSTVELTPVGKANAKAAHEYCDEKARLLNIFQARMLEVLADHLGEIDSFDVLSDLFEMATIGEGISEFRVLKSRGLIVDRFCAVIDQINTMTQLMEIARQSMIDHPRIVAAHDAMIDRIEID